MTPESKLPMGPNGLEYDPRVVGMQYPMAERDLVEALEVAETLDEVESVIYQVLAYKEGLPWGVDQYDLDSPTVLADLQTLFTTGEGMVAKRERTYYADAAIKERLAEVRKLKREGEGLTEEQQAKIDRLIALDNLVEARSIMDAAFLQRMRFCEDPGGAAELGIGKVAGVPGKVISPDAVHFRSIFRGKPGDIVDKVIKELIRLGTPASELPQGISPVEGIPSDIYAQGFTGQWVDKSDGTKEFVTGRELFQRFIKHLSETAGGRIDLVWLGFRIALFWEEISELGVVLKEDPAKEDDEPGKRSYVFGAPPLVHTLWAWIRFIDKKRHLEFGEDADGKRVRQQKFLSHSGHPGRNMDLIKDDGSSYLKATKVVQPVRPGETRKISLFEIWWENGLSLADEQFPWEATEVQPQLDDTDAISPGAVGGWMLRRSRQKKVSEYARSMPSIKDLTDTAFYVDMLRNWTKIDSGDDDPARDARTVWLRDVLAARAKSVLDFSKSPKFSYTSPREIMGTERVDISPQNLDKLRIPSMFEALEAAQKVGFISQKGFLWIREELKLRGWSPIKQ